MRNHGVGHHSPQEETLAALAQNTGANLLVHASADTPGLIKTNGATWVVVAQVTVTPRVTGKFAMTGTIVVENGGEAGTLPLLLALGHAATIDYAQTNGVTTTATENESNAIVADDNLTGVVFPLNVAVSIALFMSTSVGGANLIACAAHGAQLMVIEMST